MGRRAIGLNLDRAPARLCDLFLDRTRGLAAIRFRDRLHLLLAFSAGAVLGVVFFDVLPEV